MPMHNLKRLPRPRSHAPGIRAVPWFVVHPDGHPHEGRPIEHTMRCGQVISPDGEVCDREYLASEIDPEWLMGLPPGAQVATARQMPPDANGRLLTPTRCPRCERAALDAERAAPQGPGTSEAWWNNVLAAEGQEPPTTEDLFGGKMA
jgi:hypothetical protein